MESNLEWKKIEGHWHYRNWDYTGIAQPYVIQDLPIPNGMDIVVECTPLWRRKIGIEDRYDDDEDQLIRTIGGVEDFVANPFKRRHVKYEHGNLFPEGIRVGRV